MISIRIENKTKFPQKLDFLGIDREEIPKGLDVEFLYGHNKTDIHTLNFLLRISLFKITKIEAVKTNMIKNEYLTLEDKKVTGEIWQFRFELSNYVPYYSVGIANRSLIYREVLFSVIKNKLSVFEIEPYSALFINLINEYDDTLQKELGFRFKHPFKTKLILLTV